jgi:hypothetical protein
MPDVRNMKKKTSITIAIVGAFILVVAVAFYVRLMSRRSYAPAERITFGKSVFADLDRFLATKGFVESPGPKRVSSAISVSPEQNYKWYEKRVDSHKIGYLNLLLLKDGRLAPTYYAESLQPSMFVVDERPPESVIQLINEIVKRHAKAKMDKEFLTRGSS